MNTSKNLLARLRSNTQARSKKLQDIANYIVENAQEVQFQTITNLAKNSQSSEATVIRFCRELGFKGYSDFRMSLAVDLSQVHNNEVQFVEGDIVDISAKNAASSLLDTAKIVDRDALKRICTLLHKAKFISCVGVGASSIVAQYLNFRLLRIGKKVVTYEDTHLAAINAVRCTDGDLWFVLSSSGSTKEVLHAATEASKRGIPVVALSNISHSPLATISSETLVAARPEGPLTGGAYSSKVGALLLVDVLINSLIDIYPEYAESVFDTAEVVLPLMST